MSGGRRRTGLRRMACRFRKPQESLKKKFMVLDHVHTHRSVAGGVKIRQPQYRSMSISLEAPRPAFLESVTDQNIAKFVVATMLRL